MSELNFLNVGCGSKFHKSWTNIDMVSYSPYVKAHNILKGFPYPSNYFDVVYHSHVLEHIPKEKAFDFLRECLRVLKPGGVLRIVCPDLENICIEYLRNLNESLTVPTDISISNYEWILLEMYDQTVRNKPGGEMADFLKSPSLPNEDYIIKRIGYVGNSIINNSRFRPQISKNKNFFSKIKSIKIINIFQYFIKDLKARFSTNAMRIGHFRLGGEIHMWMYDRFSLSRLLSSCGFVNIQHLDPYNSSIPNWHIYELDIKDGNVYDPTSLFMEAKKI